MSRIFFTALILVLVLVIGIAFTALNAAPVTIDYFLGQVQTTVPWALLASMLVGILIGAVVILLLAWQIRREARRLRKELRLMETELKNLRNMPIRNT